MRIGFLIALLLGTTAGSKAQGVVSGWGRPSAYSISYAFSHSGKLLALSNDTGLALMDVPSKKIISSFSMPKSYCGYRQMVFAPNDAALLIIGCSSFVPNTSGVGTLIAGRPNEMPANFSILRCDVRTGKLTTLDSDFHDCKLAFAPDGTRFAVLTIAGDLSLYTIGSGRPLHSVQMPPRREWPNECTISFSRDGSELIAYWLGGQLSIYDARTLGSKVHIDDSIEYATPEVLGSTVFQTRDPRRDTPILIDLQTGRPAMTQPPFLNAVYSFQDEPPVPSMLHPVGAAIVGDGKYLIARYEVRTTGVPIEGGPRSGTDTLIITPLDRSEPAWGIAINPDVELKDDVPRSGGLSLLLSDGENLRLVNLSSHSLEDLFVQP